MKAKLFIAILIVTAAITQAAIDWDIYQDETINEGDFRIVTINDSLDIPSVQTTVNIYGGIFDYSIGTHDSSITNVYDGFFDGFYMSDSSTVNLYGGEFGSITAADSSILNIYGYGFSITSAGGNSGLDGYWENSTPFSLFFRNFQFPNPQVVLHIVPEPTSFCFLALGFLGARFKRKKQ